jgi:hypothetical protein
LIGFVKVRIKSSCSFQTENRQNNTPYLTVWAPSQTHPLVDHRIM